VLVTAIPVTGNEETGEARMITDQQLVGVSIVCSKTEPQSIRTSSFPIVTSGRYGLIDLSLKVNLASRLVINEDNFCELKNKKRMK